MEHRLKHTLESFRHYLHMSHGLHPEERTMDFMMELPLEIGRPTGVNTDEDVEGEEGEEREAEEPFVVRMVEGCAENWTFQDWKKVLKMLGFEIMEEGVYNPKADPDPEKERKNDIVHVIKTTDALRQA